MEIPGGVSACGGCQFIKKRVRITLLHRYLLEHREPDTVGETAEFLDFLFGAWLLAEKVVRGKAEYDQPFILVFLVKVFQPIVLRRVAAFRGRVDYEYDFSAIGLSEVNDIVRSQAPEILVEQRVVRGKRSAGHNQHQ